jgi:TPR repeat protein
MKTIYFFSCIFLFALALPATVQAKVTQEQLAEADEYYQQGEFKKAYRIYLKLAKTGDGHSQHQVAQMFASGEGTKTDLTQAYAWSVLATEGGHEDAAEFRDTVLQRIEDQAEAREEAAELKKKYGRLALQMSQERKARKRSSHRSSSCTGSHISC